MTVLVVAALAAALVVPSEDRTPGDILTRDAAALCRPGYAGAHRLVTDATKRDIYASYGIRPSGRWRVSVKGVRYWQSDYEIDHRVSLELGGSNLPANLWPQSYRLRRYNATWKDALENRLHWLVCHGSPRLPLADAQAALLGDWTAAYERYITRGPPKPVKRTLTERVSAQP